MGNEEGNYGAVRDNSHSAPRMLRDCSGHGVDKPCVSVVGSLLTKDESLGARKEQRNPILELLLGRKVLFIVPIVLV